MLFAKSSIAERFLVPKLLKSGQSFKGLSDYLNHDSNKAQTSKRVAWTHTLNCSHDHVPSAVHEMYTTQLDADALKQEAGVHGGGRSVEKPVRHASLNWHRDDAPTKEHMISTTEAFLKRMGWDQHQAIVYCHTDRHPHVHIMINAIHPETGKAMDTTFDYRRAQAWALEYEQQHEQIRCEQRLKDTSDRQDSLTREAWQVMKEGERQHLENEVARKQYDPGYMERLDNREIRETEEWKLLKSHQRDEREAFFVEGKTAYREVRSTVYRDVREEFRDEWAGFYAMAREGVEPGYLALMKEDILERQRTTLQQRRDEACADLRIERDQQYAFMLEIQQEARHELHVRQELGLSSPNLLDFVNAGSPERPMEHVDLEAEFGAAADEVTRANDEGEPLTFGGAPVHGIADEEQSAASGTGGPRDIAQDGASAAIAAFTGTAERLFDGFLGSGPPKKQPPVEKDSTRQTFARTAEAALRKVEEEEQKKRDRDYWEDRDRSRD